MALLLGLRERSDPANRRKPRLWRAVGRCHFASHGDDDPVISIIVGNERNRVVYISVGAVLPQVNDELIFHGSFLAAPPLWHQLRFEGLMRRAYVGDLPIGSTRVFDVEPTLDRLAMLHGAEIN